MNLKTILLEDTGESLDDLRADLRSRYPQCTVVAQQASATADRYQLQSHFPHLVFLGLNDAGEGFARLHELGLSRVPFICLARRKALAYDAFNNGAVHFLSQPYGQEQLGDAIGRAVWLQLTRQAKNPLGQSIFLPTPQGLERVNLPEVELCQADGAYVQFTLSKNRSLSVAQSLKTLELQLWPMGILRVNRQTLVPLRRVRRLQKGKGTALVLDNGEIIGLGPTYRVGFLHLLRAYGLTQAQGVDIQP